tara:strand:- start:604 stop:1044 length:441 start_codon:yes stop_codon:yes gene_type:complete
VCPTCSCVAHVKCWGEYLNKTSELTMHLTDNEILITAPNYTSCPQCRKHLPTVKPITRSQTSFIRYFAVLSDYISFLYNIENIESQTEKNENYRILFNTMLKYKKDIKSESEFAQLIREKLNYLYKSENWKSANIYHNLLFGEQII